MSTIVDTSHGKVSGATEAGVHVFRGIPYGGDTGHAARFRPPTSPTSWTGTRDATTNGPAAPQQHRSTSGVPQEFLDLVAPLQNFPPIGEDCLTLNVFTPATDDARRPVLVWFHGGGYSGGSGSVYNGSPLASRCDVVVVSVSHRLGLMGYLHLDQLAPDRYTSSGMSGILDLVAALEWIRDNIAAFGGDPASVTIFGESGGGWKTSTLMGMPSAQGLFHKAIVMSGPGLRAVEPDAATELAERVLHELGLTVDQIDQLHDLPIARLIEAQLAASGGGDIANAVGSGVRRIQFAPVRDGIALPAHPFDPTASPFASDVPLMIGTDRDESRTFLVMRPGFGNETQEQVEELAASIHGDRAPELLDLYAKTGRAETPTDLLVALVMTDPMWMDSIRLAERKAATGSAPVFMYRFDFETEVLGGRIKAGHGVIVSFPFDDVEAWGITGKRPERIELAHAMADAWAAFAANGDPNHDGLPKWTPYSRDERSTMIFDCPSHLAVDPMGDVREGLEAFGLTDSH